MTQKLHKLVFSLLLKGYIPRKKAKEISDFIIANSQKKTKRFLQTDKNTEGALKTISKIHEITSKKKINYWIMGGWGLDGVLGKVTRPHGDIDIFFRREDFKVIKNCLLKEGFYMLPYNPLATETLSSHRLFMGYKNSCKSVSPHLMDKEKNHYFVDTIKGRYYLPKKFLDQKRTEVTVEYLNKKYQYFIMCPELLFLITITYPIFFQTPLRKKDFYKLSKLVNFVNYSDLLKIIKEGLGIISLK